jgi:clan AA aspartic protease
MIGRVDNAGRALLDIELRESVASANRGISVWIDTGFTGELVLPQSIVDQLGLTLTGTVGAVLADGSQVILPTYECFLAWFDGPVRLEVVANEGSTPLLGVGLLLNRRLVIDYQSKIIGLE